MWLLELFYHLSVDQKHKYWIWQVLDGHICYNFTISGWQESCTCIFNLPEVFNPLMILRLFDFFSSPLQHKLHVACTIRHRIWVRFLQQCHASVTHHWPMVYKDLLFCFCISLKKNHCGHWTCTVIWICMVVAWKVGRCFAM